jgi:hypothetical protein
MKTKRVSELATIFVAVLLPIVCAAQVNSGSNGSDGAFNPTTNTVINMADHPTGIYQYTSVNIPSGIIVSFIPNANNSPVTWLVQSNCICNGMIDLTGEYNGGGRPGGYQGGSGGSAPTSGQGPGGGINSSNSYAGNASYANLGSINIGSTPPGQTYGNIFLIPLVGGSGGGGSGGSSGGYGGGAILIAASGFITISGQVYANGGNPSCAGCGGGAGSGGAIRLVAISISGNGDIRTDGGASVNGHAGQGRVRFDAYQNSFSGYISGVFTAGFQPITIPTAGQGAQLTVTSVGGVAVSSSPTGQIVTPDAVLSAQQSNPIPVVVSCANLPLNTQITVSVKPANGSAVSATGLNNSGTLGSSTATISIVIPRGGGLIYATAATGN